MRRRAGSAHALPRGAGPQGGADHLCDDRKLRVQADADKSVRPSSPFMCGHAPGNRAGAVFNTGVLWFAARQAPHDFAREWALATLQLRDPWSDDQGVFNRCHV